VLQALAANGLGLLSVDGTTTVRIEVKNVAARSGDEAAAKALDMVRKLVPEKGYRVAAQEESDGELVPVAG
jgi:hypothetical protein